MCEQSDASKTIRERFIVGVSAFIFGQRLVQVNTASICTRREDRTKAHPR